MNFEAEDLIPIVPALRNYAKRLCRNTHDTDDLVQTTLEVAWRKRGTYQGGNLRSWCFTVMFNEFAEIYRSVKRRRSLLDLAMAGYTGITACNAIDFCTLWDLERAMSSLTPAQYEAIELKRIEGLEYVEIARIQGVALGTVKSRIARGEEELQLRLAS